MGNDTNNEFEEVSAGSWAKFTTKGESVEGTFVEYLTKPATDQFGEQIVAVLSADGSTVNVGFPSKNPKYLNSVKALKPGHKVRVTLNGFYNQATGTMVDEPGKTKTGISFAKNYQILQSKLPDANYNPMTEPKISNELSVDDLPFR